MSGLNSLAEDLKRAMEEGRNCDVKLVCEGEEIPVHSLIISARSRVFATMLETDMKEKNSGVITIQGEGASVELVKQLVRFLYTDQTDEGFVMFEELLALAHMYEIQALVDYCSKNIDLNLHAVLKISARNEKFNSAVLTKRIKEILAHCMRKSEEEVTDGVVEGWTKFYKSSPEVAKDVLLKLFSGTLGCYFEEDCKICNKLKMEIEIQACRDAWEAEVAAQDAFEAEVAAQDAFEAEQACRDAWEAEQARQVQEKWKKWDAWDAEHASQVQEEWEWELDEMAQDAWEAEQAMASRDDWLAQEARDAQPYNFIEDDFTDME